MATETPTKPSGVICIDDVLALKHDTDAHITKHNVIDFLDNKENAMRLAFLCRFAMVNPRRYSTTSYRDNLEAFKKAAHAIHNALNHALTTRTNQGTTPFYTRDSVAFLQAPEDHTDFTNCKTLQNVVREFLSTLCDDPTAEELRKTTESMNTGYHELLQLIEEEYQSTKDHLIATFDEDRPFHNHMLHSVRVLLTINTTIYLFYNGLHMLYEKLTEAEAEAGEHVFA
jgi:hypothetical protein